MQQYVEIMQINTGKMGWKQLKRQLYTAKREKEEKERARSLPNGRRSLIGRYEILN